MDAGKLLDGIFMSGKNYLEKGKKLAEEQINLPKDGAERDARIDGLKKGALAAGGLALLLGTRSGRWLTGSALKIGGIAALGGIAYQAYKNWNGAEQDFRPVHELAGPDADALNMLLLRAMIAAAKADGHIDAQEQSRIEAEIGKMGLVDVDAEFLKNEIRQSPDVNALAATVPNREAAAEVYLISRIIVDVQNDMEKSYLRELASKLGLKDEEVDSLESHIGKDDVPG